MSNYNTMNRPETYLDRKNMEHLVRQARVNRVSMYLMTSIIVAFCLFILAPMSAYVLVEAISMIAQALS